MDEKVSFLLFLSQIRASKWTSVQKKIPVGKYLFFKVKKRPFTPLFDTKSAIFYNFTNFSKNPQKPSLKIFKKCEKKINLPLNVSISEPTKIFKK